MNKIITSVLTALSLCGFLVTAYMFSLPLLIYAFSGLLFGLSLGSLCKNLNYKLGVGLVLIYLPAVVLFVVYFASLIANPVLFLSFFASIALLQWWVENSDFDRLKNKLKGVWFFNFHLVFFCWFVVLVVGVLALASVFVVTSVYVTILLFVLAPCLISLFLFFQDFFRDFINRCRNNVVIASIKIIVFSLLSLIVGYVLSSVIYFNFSSLLVEMSIQGVLQGLALGVHNPYVIALSLFIFIVMMLSIYSFHFGDGSKEHLLLGSRLALSLKESLVCVLGFVDILNLRFVVFGMSDKIANFLILIDNVLDFKNDAHFRHCLRQLLKTTASNNEIKTTIVDHRCLERNVPKDKEPVKNSEIADTIAAFCVDENRVYDIYNYVNNFEGVTIFDGISINTHWNECIDHDSAFRAFDTNLYYKQIKDHNSIYYAFMSLSILTGYIFAAYFGAPVIASFGLNFIISIALAEFVVNVRLHNIKRLEPWIVSLLASAVLSGLNIYGVINLSPIIILSIFAAVLLGVIAVKSDLGWRYSLYNNIWLRRLKPLVIALFCWVVSAIGLVIGSILLAIGLVIGSILLAGGLVIGSIVLAIGLAIGAVVLAIALPIAAIVIGLATVYNILSKLILFLIYIPHVIYGFFENEPLSILTIVTVPLLYVVSALVYTALLSVNFSMYGAIFLNLANPYVWCITILLWLSVVGMINSYDNNMSILNIVFSGINKALELLFNVFVVPIVMMLVAVPVVDNLAYMLLQTISCILFPINTVTAVGGGGNYKENALSKSLQKSQGVFKLVIFQRFDSGMSQLYNARGDDNDDFKITL